MKEFEVCTACYWMDGSGVELNGIRDSLVDEAEMARSYVIVVLVLVDDTLTCYEFMHFSLLTLHLLQLGNI